MLFLARSGRGAQPPPPQIRLQRRCVAASLLQTRLSLPPSASARPPASSFGRDETVTRKPAILNPDVLGGGAVSVARAAVWALAFVGWLAVLAALVPIGASLFARLVEDLQPLSAWEELRTLEAAVRLQPQQKPAQKYQETMHVLPN